jgi:hypothetical protein
VPELLNSYNEPRVTNTITLTTYVAPPGDMLIEYVGELIRPSVSDARERRMYDKLVGSGTYIFTLNDMQHIDATRAGTWMAKAPHHDWRLSRVTTRP